MSLEKKKCFVICPIGETGSPIRKRSDNILDYMIRPVLSELGYIAIRADEIATPGVITSQVIQHVIDDDLVIADLSGGNPNVYYELAVRHMVKKPIVQIIELGGQISFDVQIQRTIYFDYQDLKSVNECMKRIKEQIRAVEVDSTKVDSPISQAIDLKALLQSDRPEDTSIAQMSRSLESVSDKLNTLIRTMRFSKYEQTSESNRQLPISDRNVDEVLDSLTKDLPKGITLDRIKSIRERVIQKLEDEAKNNS